MARTAPIFATSILALTLSSCSVVRPTTAFAPAPATNLAQVLADPAVERVTRGLQTSGFELKAASVSRVPLLGDAPGAAFALADGALHIHAYPDAGRATTAVNRIVNAPAGKYNWPSPPIFYRCGTAIAVYAGSTPSVASALGQLCASPFYVHPSLREHSAELLAEGPADLRLQVARLDVRRAQIAAQVRRQARRMPGGRGCRSIDLPPSAFLPVEITGDLVPELAVSLNQISCPRGLFGGVDLGIVQFWSLAARQPRLVLEQQIHGFTPRNGSLTTLQPGSSCGATAAVRCLVNYQWNPRTRQMQPGARTPVAASSASSAIAFDHDLRRRASGTD